MPETIRQPAVAGFFYPADPAALRAEVDRFLGAGAVAADGRDAPGRLPALALMVPHAGYIYSGGVAGATFAAAELPRTLFILCPNHTGEGRPLAVMNRGAWRTPLGDVPVDEALADRLLDACGRAEVDSGAHGREHALEVQLPFLQVMLGDFTFVPICVGTGDPVALAQLGHAIGRASREDGRPAAVIISSDMSHYIHAERAREKDMMAVDRILAMDPVGLLKVVRERDISMCGIHPAVAGLTAAIDSGAGTARLVAYSNSGVVSGDYDQVVGYAGVHIS